MDDGDRRQREGEQHCRHDASLPGAECLHAIVDGDRQHARLARDAAADHEDDAELAERVREGKRYGGDDAGPGERQLDAPHVSQRDSPLTKAASRTLVGSPRRRAGSAARRTAG